MTQETSTGSHVPTIPALTGLRQVGSRKERDHKFEAGLDHIMSSQSVQFQAKLKRPYLTLTNKKAELRGQ